MKVGTDLMASIKNRKQGWGVAQWWGTSAAHAWI
jgi:hypothetical protein